MNKAEFIHHGEKYIAFAKKGCDYLHSILTSEGENISFLDCSIELIEKAKKAVCMI
jgi:hypothetical protein